MKSPDNKIRILFFENISKKKPHSKKECGFKSDVNSTGQSSNFLNDDISLILSKSMIMNNASSQRFNPTSSFAT